MTSPVSPAEQATPSAAQPSTVQSPAADVAADANPPRFDLAAWIATPEFREMHTAPVLEGLELLARPEPRHRALGAIRITAAGRDARTALPVLRKLLTNEPDKIVRLRIAQSVLQILPDDRTATECLSDLLSDRTDAQLRQDAASALGGAAGGRNAIAIARLTDALDDCNPRVRAAAAASLALFGPAAADSVSRLEGAAANDVASVQQAALVALASIRGTKNELPANRVQVPPADEPVVFQPFGSSRPAPLPAPLSATSSPSTVPSVMGVPLATGRVKLTDPAPVTEADALDTSASEPIARGSGSLPPKLFPADRMFGSRALSPAPEMSDDDSVPTEATDANAPTKPLTFAPAAAAQQQSQAAPATPWPVQSQLQSLLPVQTTLPSQLPHRRRPRPQARPSSSSRRKRVPRRQAPIHENGRNLADAGHPHRASRLRCRRDDVSQRRRLVGPSLVGGKSVARPPLDVRRHALPRQLQGRIQGRLPLCLRRLRFVRAPNIGTTGDTAA